MTVREALDLFASFYERAGRPARAHRRPRARGQARHGLPQPVGRPEAAPLDRPRARRPAADRDPRRAVDRARPAGASRDVAAHRVDPRPWRDRPPRDPPDGGGRASRRSGRGLRPRPGDRARHAGRHRLDGRPGAAAAIPPVGARRGRASSPTSPRCGSVERTGPIVVVTGTGNLIGAVTSVLARHQIVANDLRIEQTNLDDAYLALTGRLAAAPRRSCHERISSAHRHRGEAALPRPDHRGSRRSPCRRSSCSIFGVDLRPPEPDPALGGLRFIDVFVPSLVVITVGTLGIQTLPIRLATYREKGVPAAALDDSRSPARAAGRPAGHLHGHRGHRAGPAHRRRPRRLRRPAAAATRSATSRRSCSAMTSLFAIGLLVAAVAPVEPGRDGASPSRCSSS